MYAPKSRSTKEMHKLQNPIFLNLPLFLSRPAIISFPDAIRKKVANE